MFPSFRRDGWWSCEKPYGNGSTSSCCAPEAPQPPAGICAPRPRYAPSKCPRNRTSLSCPWPDPCPPRSRSSRRSSAPRTASNFSRSRGTPDKTCGAPRGRDPSRWRLGAWSACRSRPAARSGIHSRYDPSPPLSSLPSGNEPCAAAPVDRWSAIAPCHPRKSCLKVVTKRQIV